MKRIFTAGIFSIVSFTLFAQTETINVSGHGQGLVLKNSSDVAGTYIDLVDHDGKKASIASFDDNYGNDNFKNSIQFFARNGKHIRFATSTDGTAGTNKFTILNNGNVGIGVKDPESKLHIKGDDLSFWISRETYVSTNSVVGIDFRQQTNNGFLRTGGAIKSISANSYTGGDGTTYDSDLALYSTGDGNLTEGLRIDHKGNIGIGTSNPSSGRLHIYKNATTGNWGQVTTSNTGLTNAILRIQDNAASLYIDGNTLYTSGAQMNIGTKDNNAFSIGTSDTERLRINSNGQVGIGTGNSGLGDHRLAVEGSIGAREIKVTAPGQGWPDYVFKAGYNLPTLEEVDSYIAKNNHLPEIPSEAEVKENGINLGEMDAKLLQKIEELTLYMIDMNKRVGQLEQDNGALKSEIRVLKSK